MLLRPLARLIVGMLPARARRVVRRNYYARLLRRLSVDLEVDLPLVRHALASGDTVLDIGANIGGYTKFLSEWVGPSGRVLAVEPVPSTFEILCSNVKRLKLRNVRPINCAVSASRGHVTMVTPSWESGGENIYLAHVADESEDSRLPRVTVESRTIDELVRGGPVAFIKCDTEGHELSCLRGALETIRRGPAWLIEVTGEPDRQGSAAAVFDLLLGEGYRAYWCDGLRLQRRERGHRSVNYWFLTPAHERRLAQLGLIAPSAGGPGP